jgi:hypothetical protein
MAWDLRQIRRNLHLTQKQMAMRLGMSKSHYQILESPRGFVPEPLPPPGYTADRLKAIKREQMARSQVRKMPNSHCPLHNCRLAKARESWLWRLRGKMKRWWAKCVVGGEFYTVRSDGVVRNAPRWKPRDLRPGPGRPANRRALLPMLNEIAAWSGLSEQAAKKKFEYGEDKATDCSVAKAAKAKEPA